MDWMKAVPSLKTTLHRSVAFAVVELIFLTARTWRTGVGMLGTGCASLM